MTKQELDLNHRFVYYGDTLEWIYLDLENPNTSITFEIRDSSNNLKSSITTNTDVNGIATSSKLINKDELGVGLYYLIANCNGKTTSEMFEVSYAGVLIAKGLETLLQGFQKIPVYDELGVCYEEGGLKLARFTYGNWIYNEKTFFRGNDKDFNLYTEIYPLYSKGIVYIKDPNIDITEDIFATYSFPFFSETQFYSYLQLALDEINSQPPITDFKFEDLPQAFDAFLTMKAYTYCLKQALLDIEFWNNRVIFPEPPGIRGTLNSLLTQASQDATTMKGQIKGRWVLNPVGVSSFKINVPYSIDNVNYRYYTVASLTGPGAGGLLY